jgi:hypothetical protein
VEIIFSDKNVFVLMDATYWRRKFGVVVMKDSRTGKILWRKFIHKKETLSNYKAGTDWLFSKKFKIEGIVCDGLQGLFQISCGYRIQMCQFHQIQIVKRYLTEESKIEAFKELLTIIKMICNTKKESFIDIFEQWTNKWLGFLKERSIDREAGKNQYTHRRVRSVYLSIKRNMCHTCGLGMTINSWEYPIPIMNWKANLQN